MRIENVQLRDFIRDANLIEASVLDGAYQEAESQKRRLGELLLEKKLIEEAQLRKLYAYILGVPFVDLQKETVSADVLQAIPSRLLKSTKLWPLRKTAEN